MLSADKDPVRFRLLAGFENDVDAAINWEGDVVVIGGGGGRLSDDGAAGAATTTAGAPWLSF